MELPENGMFYFDPTIGWSTIVQLVGFLVAIVTVFYQMHAHRNLQRDKHRQELQVSTYEKIAERMSFVSPVGVAMTFQIIYGALENAVAKKNETGAYVPPPFDPKELYDDFKKVSMGLWEIASTIQTYEIVASNLPLFREALIIKLRQLGDAYLPLVQVLPNLLISEKGITDPEKLLIPDKQDFRTLQTKIDEFHEVAYYVASFLHDIQVEMQNSLLGALFYRKVPVRVPKDKSHIVLTSEDHEMLERVRRFVKESS